MMILTRQLIIKCKMSGTRVIGFKSTSVYLVPERKLGFFVKIKDKSAG
jgi:hypothetical protein